MSVSDVLKISEKLGVGKSGRQDKTQLRVEAWKIC